MVDKIIVANWKSNKNLEDAISWVERVGPELIKLNKKAILCPPAIFIIPLAKKIDGSGFSKFLILGSQDVSSFPEGAYTGAVAASQLARLVKFSLVGHSERRKYFFETDKDVIEKLKLLLDSQITPTLCVSDLAQLDSYINEGKIIVENWDKIIFVYEPPSAISAGGEYRPDTPEDANQNALKIREKIGKPVKTIYGGSINLDNARSFFSQENIDGGLVGQASLNPQTFIQIVETTNS